MCDIFCRKIRNRVCPGSVILRWRASLWKLVWSELLIYTLVFISISIVYRFVLDESMQIEFEKAVVYSKKFHTGMPLTFLLGFYVSMIVNRWWAQYTKLPWPDTIAYMLRAVVIEKDRDTARTIRKTIVRYSLLSYVLCLRRMSLRVRKRFPTLRHLVAGGLLTDQEAARIGSEDSPLEDRFSSKWWLPLKWNAELLHNALTDGIITSAGGYTSLVTFTANFRADLTEVENYSHVSVPLVYTQVVTLAVYVYFAVELVGDQVLIPRKEGDENVHIWLPLFLGLKFLFFFGWLRVAETLYDPFGDDDQDFRMNELIDRHARVTMEIVDDETETPELTKTSFQGRINDSWVDEDEVIESDSQTEGKKKEEESEAVAAVLIGEEEKESQPMLIKTNKDENV